MNKFKALVSVVMLLIFVCCGITYAEETPETITIENNEEFAAVYATKNEYADIVKEFAKKYEGDLIEFDGYVAHIARHGSYKTRFDYLICCGPNRESDFYGPLFQFSDVNYNDFNFNEEDAPDSIPVGMNLHIIAKVVEYNAISGLFMLDPVAVSVIKDK